MKKTILTSIVAIAALFAMPVAAQTTDAAKDAAKTEQTQKRIAQKDKARKDMKGERKNMKRTDAFEGINLTDAQKESLKALRPQRPERGERNDSVARPDRRKMKADYVNAVKGILTPDQYVIFLENIVIKDAMVPGGGHDVHKKAKHGDRHGKAMKKGHGPKKDVQKPEKK